MKKINMIGFVMLLSQMAHAYVAEGTPPLHRTRLYQQITQDCHEVNLATWQHPSRKILAEKNVVLLSVEQCNNQRYPIYIVKFPYDPQGQHPGYFSNLYQQVKRANNDQSLSFVDQANQLVVNITVGAAGVEKIDYEHFSQ